MGQGAGFAEGSWFLVRGSGFGIRDSGVRVRGSGFAEWALAYAIAARTISPVFRSTLTSTN